MATAQPPEWLAGVFGVGLFRMTRISLLPAAAKTGNYTSAGRKLAL
jgi:hypothetical protein